MSEDLPISTPDATAEPVSGPVVAPDAGPDAAPDAAPDVRAGDEPLAGPSASITIDLPGAYRGAPRKVHIIGTAHVSRKSVEEVQRVIRAVKPDTVCVELDQMRYEALTDETRWRKLDIFQVIRQGKVLFLMSSLALQAYQRRLGDQLGVRPGAELLAGVDVAKEIGAEVVLVDRDVQATLRRTWANLGFFNKVKLIGALGASVFDTEEIDEDQIEALKDREHINDMMSEFARVMPEVKGPLIDERDQYLMSAIEDAPGNTLVAVVGAGHVEGMTKQVGKSIDREALAKIPPPSKWMAALKWVIPVVIFAAFYWGYSKHEGESLVDMLYAWILPNAIFAGIFTAIAGGKVLSVITSIIASPITSLNPTIGAGMVVGLVEAWLRKPTVEDCEKLGKEVTTWAGMRKNPFSHVLIVAIAANLGSMIGAYVGFGWVLSYL
jgi:pheromone shutdown-related protein TraB